MEQDIPSPGKTGSWEHLPADQQASALRILDANGNRASEGLRAAEDYFRFHQNDGLLSQTCKEMRHQVSQTLASLSTNQQRLACRSTRTDVGANNETSSEFDRLSLTEVAHTNLGRAAEALRTLEEYAKLISADAARHFEAVRYQTYTLAKTITHAAKSHEVFSDRTLYVIVDTQGNSKAAWRERIREVAAGGVDVIQLRDKGASDRDVLEASKWIRQICHQENILFVMNDRADLARLSAADGLHVGQEELTVAQARSIVGPNMVIGVSTHNIQQAEQAVLDGADYIGVGPVFPSKTKDFNEHVGTDLIRNVHSRISLPAYAIGGITTENVGTLLSAGGQRIAVSHAIWKADAPTLAAQRFKKALSSVLPN